MDTKPTPPAPTPAIPHRFTGPQFVPKPRCIICQVLYSEHPK